MRLKVALRRGLDADLPSDHVGGRGCAVRGHLFNSSMPTFNLTYPV